MATIATNQPVNDNFGMFSQQNITVSEKDSSRFSPSKKSYDNLGNENPSPTDTVSTLNLSEHSSPTNSAVNSPILLSIQNNELDSFASHVEAPVVEECPSQMKRFSDGKTKGCVPADINNIIIEISSSTSVVSVATKDVESNSTESSSEIVGAAPTTANTFIRPQLVKTDSCKSGRSLALLFNVDDSDADTFAEKILDSSRKERERESFDNVNTFNSGNSSGSGCQKIGGQQQPVTILDSNRRISCSVQQRKQSDAPHMIPQRVLPKSTSAHSLIDPSVTQKQIKVNELRKIITPLYEKHNPNKLLVVDSLIFNYCDGKEFSLFRQLEEKYTLSAEELELFDDYLKKYDKQCGSASAKGVSETPRSVVSPRATAITSSSNKGNNNNNEDKTVSTPLPSLQRVVFNKPSIPALPFDKLHPSSPGYIALSSVNSSGGGKNKSSNKTAGSMIVSLSKSSSMNMSSSSGSGSLTPALSKNNSSSNNNITASANDTNKATTIEKKKRRVKCVIC